MCLRLKTIRNATIATMTSNNNPTATPTAIGIVLWLLEDRRSFPVLVDAGLLVVPTLLVLDGEDIEEEVEEEEEEGVEEDEVDEDDEEVEEDKDEDEDEEDSNDDVEDEEAFVITEILK